MSEKITTIGKVVFGLVFVILIVVLAGIIFGKMSETSSKLNNTLTSIDATSVNSYDEATVKGSAVINAIKSGQSIGGSSKLGFIVETVESQDYYGYCVKASANGAAAMYTKEGTSDPAKFENVDTSSIGIKITDDYVYYNQTDSREDNYISKTANFKTHLLYNANNVLSGISFIQEN